METYYELSKTVSPILFTYKLSEAHHKYSLLSPALSPCTLHLADEPHSLQKLL